MLRRMLLLLVFLALGLGSCAQELPRDKAEAVLKGVAEKLQGEQKAISDDKAQEIVTQVCAELGVETRAFARYMKDHPEAEDLLVSLIEKHIEARMDKTIESIRSASLQRGKDQLAEELSRVEEEKDQGLQAVEQARDKELRELKQDRDSMLRHLGVELPDGAEVESESTTEPPPAGEAAPEPEEERLPDEPR